MTNTTNNRQDLYQHVTTRIIDDLERGVRPWLKPWSGMRHHASAPAAGFEVMRDTAVREQAS